jgi:surfeit locus 1 family protein
MGSRKVLRPAPLIVAMAAVAILVGLGVWQLDRAVQKKRLLSEFTAHSRELSIRVTAQPLDPDRAYFPAHARGEFDSAGQFLLDNRTHKGQPGFHVLTPFRINDSNVHILVDRGWIPLTGTRETLPQPQTPDGMREIRGQLAVPTPGFTLEREAPPFDAPLRQNLDLAGLANLAPYPLQPYVLRLGPDEFGGFVREWPAPASLSVSRHQAYAIQWFVMAVVFIGVFVALARRERRKIV